MLTLFVFRSTYGFVLNYKYPTKEYSRMDLMTSATNVFLREIALISAHGEEDEGAVTYVCVTLQIIVLELLPRLNEQRCI